ncbi:phage capsid protein [Ralstonia pseudosolanacearum]|uniref:recombination directionality factor n=1 Tax=Ralstonia pseudosolanacearum TaxID=1310165 RepID=UPI001402AA60|nr:phage capsid protein [Ralstonia pseudosolanacearum]KAF3462103.1 phage capsid protein [Ralstonia solanacearum]NJZ81639.1 phage capsid protein [Ralstonia solanacearum]NKA77075.1 phage capsid protein [Ralstonia solanacearum]NKA93083.1 phage capsid protein [Ralstonia solanacearum]NKF93556.1 phage capsid protein [Ralstonia solanacearum]
MLRGLALTPPIIGRISIGRVVERNGKRLPEKDDQFTLTTQVQQRGEWVLHPLNESLRKATPGKLRSIPVRLLFNDPDLNLRAEYTLFDRETGRPVCVGNGERCKRVEEGGIAVLPCPSPEGCQFGGPGGCKPYGRLNVSVGDTDDELGSFVLRTTSFNSIRTLAARLRYFNAVSGNLLACLSLRMVLRGKSTAQSCRAAIYYVDLAVREGATLEATIAEARELDARRKAAGFDQAALDAAAKVGFANGAFEDSPEEAAAVAEEFFPEPTTSSTDASNTDTPAEPKPPTLRDKLDRKAALLSGTAA